MRTVYIYIVHNIVCMDLRESNTLFYLEKKVEQVQKSFHQMKGDIGMHNAKNQMIVQSCITPPYIMQVFMQGLRMIVLSSCYEGFSHCASTLRLMK